MENRINELLEKLEKLKENNVSHDELGQTMGFHEVETIKNEFCNFTSSLLTEYKLNIQSFPKKTIDKFIELMKTTINNFEARVKNIEKIIAKGVNQPQYPNDRTSTINQIKAFMILWKKIFTYMNQNCSSKK